MNIGATSWVIADGFIPAQSNGLAPEMVSHESACILNAGDSDAHVEIFLYFAEREPIGPYRLLVPAQRARHQRFNDLQEPKPVPVGVDYCCLIRSDAPIVVQHTRLDSRQAANALMSMLAYPAAGIVHG